MKKATSGFTIVELATVIAVIAILASISLVYYNGATKRAATAATQSSVNDIKIQVAAHAQWSNQYPASVTDCPKPAAGNTCYKTAPDDTIRYTKGTSNDKPFYEIAILSKHQFNYESNAEKTGYNEFLQYTDLAPFIDKYGLVEYEISFDAKTASPTAGRYMSIYMQNGSGAKYSFGTSFPISNTFERKVIKLKPSNYDLSLTQSILAFYGTYHTGNIPTIKNVNIKLAN